MIHVQCPSCGVKLKSPDSAAGKKTKCPKCGTPITIPEPVLDAEVVSNSVPDDDYENSDPYGLEDDVPGAAKEPDQPESPEGGNRRPCPACGEMIIVGAAKCRFCGEIFDAKLKKKTKKRRGSSPDDEDMTTSEWVVALLCSGIGCIVGIVYMIQGKPKGGKMFGISLLMVVIWNIIQFAIKSSLQHQGMGP